ncbi:MAG TPA: sodium:proton antiporter [Bacteroidia bacterium]|nr:sodium:proton antiporter [Bacteroidia bacterium]
MAIIISISALFGYANHKWLKLPTTIGVMLISVILAIVLKEAEGLHLPFTESFRLFLTNFNFSRFVLDFILCFLLFAGSLHVKLINLKGARANVISYSTIGVIISTLIIGYFTKLILDALDYEVSIIKCLLFGALVSPTDPIAVIGILSKYNIPKKLKTEIIGESLFNDGVGVVVFTVILSVITGGEDTFTPGSILKLIVVEVIGGLGIGLFIGYIGYLLMKSIDHYQTEIMITLAVVTGGYSLASSLHASGPLAMVVAGLIIGNKGKADAMSDTTAEYVDKFWELVDEICNTILFALMGLELFLVPYNLNYFAVGCMLVFVALGARFISLLPAFYIFNRHESRKLLGLSVLTWGGLRGGISLALALSLVKSLPEANLFLVSAYCIVLFSILVQGLTIKKLLTRYQ